MQKELTFHHSNFLRNGYHYITSFKLSRKKWPHPFSETVGVRDSNKISGAQLDHKPFILQKELIFYHLYFLRNGDHKIT